MKLVYLPIGVVASLLAGQVSKKVFDFVWGQVEDQEAPRPKHREIDLRLLAVALLIEGALFRLVRGLVDHYARRGFAALTGSWPGEERPEPE
ncbi:MAG: hypothetical protein JWQ20_826 [Conexibacter sp.]|nr:hypothetical protein [Conexibacter sp.]